MRILVAGGRGFIGRYIVKNLIKDSSLNAEVAILTRNLELAKKTFSEEKVSIIPLTEGWKKAKEQIKGFSPEVVINTVGILYEKKKNTYEVAHIETVKHMLEVFDNLKLRRFIHISACGVGRNRFSRYFLTKEEAERLIKTSGVPYTILRPSIVMGKEQLLFEQLRKIAPYTPLFFVPSTKVQPVHIKDLVDIVHKTITEGVLKNKTCEVGGPKVYTMAEFFKKALNLLGYRRIVLQMPWWFFISLLPVLSPLGITTRENLQMVRTPNVCHNNCAPKILKKMRNPFEINF